MKKLKKTLVVLILCNLMLLLTAMTCDDPVEYRKVIFENQSNDTIMSLSDSGRPFTSETAIELFWQGGQRRFCHPNIRKNPYQIKKVKYYSWLS